MADPEEVTGPGTPLAPDAADALAAIVRSSDDAIYSKDKTATITSWNGAAERLYGYTAEEAIGRPISMLLPDDRQGEELGILHRILQGEHIEHFETQRLRKDGKRVEVSISVSPVHNSRGEIVQAAVISRNITEQKRLQTTLDETRRLQAVDRRKRALELNDEVVQGLAAAKFAFESGHHEQGLEAVAATLARAKGIVSRLLDEHSLEAPIEPGDLTRETPAD